MKHRIWIAGIFVLFAVLLLLQVPSAEADAADTSDFVIQGGRLIKYRGSEERVTIPDTVDIIGESAFEDNVNIELVVIPKTVKRIEAYAFWGCDNLEEVILGKGLTQIDDYAFTECRGLKSMTIPSNIQSIGIQSFANCVNMTDIYMEPEVTRIDASAFDGCYQLTIHAAEGTVADRYAKELYERQKEMPGYAAAKEQTLEEENIPVSTDEDSTIPVSTPEPVTVTEPGQELGVTKVVGNRAVVLLNNTDPTVLQGSEASEEILTENANKIAARAYYQDDSIQEMAIPENISEIGEMAFARSSLTAITLPQGLQKIDYAAFYHCDALREIQLPDTVTEVAAKAFAHSGWVDDFLESGTEDFLISGGVLVAYRGKREEITVPDTVRVIAAEAFQGHGELKKVILPDSVEVIGEDAFEDDVLIQYENEKKDPA